MQTAIKGIATTTLAVLLMAGTVTAAQAVQPRIDAFAPASGPPGTSVTLTGVGFTGATAVAFAGTPAVFAVNLDTQITTSVPAGATTGRIKVTTPAGSDVSSTNFKVTGVAAPAIDSFSPAFGPVGTQVDILGNRFTDVTVVRFSGVSATFTILRAAKIRATVPAGATTGRITVVAPSGTATSSTSFRVTTGGAPHINGFSPSSGPVGTSVTINGTNFAAATKVKFHGSVATFAVNSDTKITATVPAGATTGPISVWAPAGTDFSSADFKVAGPSIDSFSPVSGPVGTKVSIFGTGFTGATAVKFNGTNATYTVVRNGKITAVVPSGATTGRISVTTPRGTNQSAKDFTVAGPKIDSFSPASGPPGTSVSIYGSGFAGATVVRFNGAAASFSVVSGAKIKATVPSGATSGPITVVAPSGTAKSSSNFTVLASNHRRRVTLRLSGSLRASGHVGVPDGFAACRAHVAVTIRRYRQGRWRWVASASTRADGSYRTALPDRRGVYQARIRKTTLSSGVTCSADLSRRHRHRN